MRKVALLLFLVVAPLAAQYSPPGGAGGSGIAGAPSTWPSTFPPAAHAGSHAAGGGDPVTLTEAQITNLSTDLAGKAASSAATTVNGVLCALGAACTVADGTKVPLASANQPNGYLKLDPSGNAVIGSTSPTVIDPVAGISSPAVRSNNTLLSPVGQMLPKWRAALAGVRNGTADAKILVLGTSVSDGIGGATAATVPVYSSYLWRLYQLANAGPLTPTAPGLGVGISYYSQSTPDQRWTYGTGWSFTSPAYGFIGSVVNGNNPAGNLVFTPGGSITYDSFDVYYVNYNAGGTLGITASGGSTTTVQMNTCCGVYKATVTAASAATTNAVTITASGTGGVYIVGVEPFLSTTKKVRIGIVAQPGCKATDYAGGTDANFGMVKTLTAYAPNLVILELGINDANTGVTAANFQAAMATIIAWSQGVGADVLIVTVPPSQGALSTLETAYQAQVTALMTTYHIPAVDIWTRFGSTWNTAFMSDAFHPNDSGHWDMGAALHALLFGRI